MTANTISGHTKEAVLIVEAIRTEHSSSCLKGFEKVSKADARALDGKAVTKAPVGVPHWY